MRVIWVMALAMLALTCRERPQVPGLSVRHGAARYSMAPVYSRAGDTPSPVRSADLRRAAEWRRAASIDPSELNLLRLATAHVSLSNFGDAIALFEGMRVLAPCRPQVLSDLAAAYLDRGERSASAEDAVRALDAAEAAVACDPHHLPSLFNAAIAQSKVGLADRAATTWRAYLAEETDPGWRAEAEGYLANQQESRGWQAGTLPDASQFHLARRWLLEVALPAGGQQGAAVADEIYRVTGDPMWRDAVAEAASKPAASLLSAYGDFRDGFQATRADDFPARGAAFESACRVLAAANSVLVPYCFAELSWIQYLRHQYPAALRSAEAAQSLARARSFHYVEARAAWSEANTLSASGLTARALVIAARAVDLLERANAQTDLARALILQAELLSYVGRQPDSWRARARALSCAAQVNDADTSYIVNPSASLQASKLGLPNAALAFAEFSSVDELAPLKRVVIQQRRITAALALNNISEARDALNRAWSDLRASSDPRARTMAADVSVAEGRVRAAESDFAGARESFLNGASQMGVEKERSRTDALLLSATMEIKLGRSSEARTLLESASDKLAARLRNAGPEPFEMTERAVLAQTAADLVVEADHEQAVGLRSFYDRIKSVGLAGVDNPRGPNDGQGLLYYLVSGERVAAWYEAAGRTRFQQLNVSSASITERAGKLQLYRISGASETACKAILATLWRDLLGPFQLELGQVTALHVVLDGPMYAVPFPALLHAETGRHLVQDLTLTFSSTMSGEAPPRSPSKPRILLVANPQAANLPSLPFAVEEVARIASGYDRASTVVLAGAAATESQFRREAAGATVVHFAGHALADRSAPLHSHLALSAGSGEAGDDGALEVMELRRGMLPGSIVVLAACQTASTRGDSRFGIGHLADQFLSAGATGVVAAVDDIPDDAGALYVAFHRDLASGDSGPVALQRAQVEVLTDTANSRNLFRWASTLYYQLPPIRSKE